jgi:GTP-binding protein HflX
LSRTNAAGRQRRRLTATEVDLGVVQQRALLVGTTAATNGDVEAAESSLEELGLLADTAGALVVYSDLQRRAKPDPATYVGTGKAAELAAVATALDVDVVVFDDELSPAQLRNLEQVFKCDVVDRVALILDIFAMHATSQEGMVQVELAQHRYRMPRLRGRGMQLSQQGGGISGARRGPGETQLEVDRRRVVRRVQKLERDLQHLAANRAVQRKARTRRGLLRVALAGYTNSGKSTLLNRLTDAGVLVEDRLFSTLDSTTRRLALPGGETILVSDTVGFVQRLPHQLVEAFRSTLDEAADVDLLLHVVDASSNDPGARIAAVHDVLGEIGAREQPELLVWNKSDLADAVALDNLLATHPGSVAVSAVTGAGIAELLQAIAQRLRALSRVVEFSIPHDRGDVLAALHREGEVLVEVHEAEHTRVQARVPDALIGRFAEFVTR